MSLLTTDPDKPIGATRLTPKGLAISHFLFRDGPQIQPALSEVEMWDLGNRLLTKWDGSKTLLEIYAEENELKANASGS